MWGVVQKIFLRSDHMSDRDRMVLSPLHKWKKYRRFPFKIIIQSLVLALVVLEIYVVSSQFTTYTRANRATFDRFFMLPDTGRGIFSISSLKQQLNVSVCNYFNLHTFSVTDYEPTTDANGHVLPVYLSVTSFRYINGSLSQLTEVKEYPLTVGEPYGPFAGSWDEVKPRLRALIKMSQTVQLNDAGILADFGLTHFVWNVTLHYVAEGGRISITLELLKNVRSGMEFYESGWMSLLLSVLAIVSALLSGKALVSSAMVYRRTRARFQAIPEIRLAYHFAHMKITPVCYSWDQVPLSIKLQFFSSWHVISIVGDIMVILSCMLSLVTKINASQDADTISRLFLGLGCLILCSNLTKYLEYDYAFYTLILTLRNSYWKVLKFTLSCLPLFFGYALCGVALFSPYSASFVDLDSTAVTLFALLNGDDIHATFTDLAVGYPWIVLSRIYLYTFILLFITAVLNVFIFIIEDGYHLAKVLSSTDMKQLQENNVDHDSLLLWKVLRRTLDMKKLFDIIEEEYPEATKPGKALLIDDNDTQTGKDEPTSMSSMVSLKTFDPKPAQRKMVPLGSSHNYTSFNKHSTSSSSSSPRPASNINQNANINSSAVDRIPTANRTSSNNNQNTNQNRTQNTKQNQNMNNLAEQNTSTKAPRKRQPSSAANKRLVPPLRKRVSSSSSSSSSSELVMEEEGDPSEMLSDVGIPKIAHGWRRKKQKTPRAVGEEGGGGSERRRPSASKRPTHLNIPTTTTTTIQKEKKQTPLFSSTEPPVPTTPKRSRSVPVATDKEEDVGRKEMTIGEKVAYMLELRQKKYMEKVKKKLELSQIEFMEQLSRDLESMLLLQGFALHPGDNKPEASSGKRAGAAASQGTPSRASSVKKTGSRKGVASTSSKRSKQKDDDEEDNDGDVHGSGDEGEAWM